MTETRGLTTPKVRRAWYALDTSEAIGSRGLQRYRLFGVPLVVWRTSLGAVRALTDRCPHRNIALSEGARRGDEIQCGYHGWTFDGGGRCTRIPGLDGPADRPGRRAEVWTLREQQGLVWCWGVPDEDPGPTSLPTRFPEADDPRYLTVRRRLRAPGTLHQVVENALDVPHTAFLHGGWFRQDGPRRAVSCTVRRFRDRAECVFEGETPPTGLAARLLGVRGGDLVHVDRFVLPSITEVEYRLGHGSHLLLRGACTPVDEDHTDVIACVSIRTPLPHALVRAVIQPVALRIFSQDAVVLRQQRDCVDQTGGARFVSTEIDVLGAPILRLLREAADGTTPDELGPLSERRVTMWL